uniref:Uncharacterized protein n=1 Tax=Rhizophora mucronata TaxID=61149 RepID=A0A2P2QTH1_RHIMU
MSNFCQGYENYKHVARNKIIGQMQGASRFYCCKSHNKLGTQFNQTTLQFRTMARANSKELEF